MKRLFAVIRPNLLWTAVVSACFSVAGVAHAATPVAAFTVTATNVTIGSTGNGLTDVTLTSVNGYAGSIFLTCSITGPPSASRSVPICVTTPPVAYSLSASQTTAGSRLALVPPDSAIPAVRTAGIPKPHISATGHGSPLLLAGGMAFASLAFFRLWGIRPRRRSLYEPLFGLMALAALVGLAACGSGRNHGMTPGTYGYRITASDEQNRVVTTTIQVTVQAP